MKLHLSSAFKFTLTVLIFGILMACDLMRSNTECEPVPPTGVTELFIVFPGDTVTVEAEYWSTDLYDFDIVRAPNDGAGFNAFYRFADKHTDLNPDSLYGLVFYNHAKISKRSVLSEGHVDGFSMYSISGDTMYHQLFVRKAGRSFVEIKEVNVAVPAITSNHMNYYLSQYVYGPSDEGPKSYITAFSEVALLYAQDDNLTRDVPMVYTVDD